MTNYTPADLMSWPLSNLLAEYGALVVMHDRAIRVAESQNADVDLPEEYVHGLTLVADEIERRASR